tara:strand:+ start:585 stop:1517 length:933 start_codon:yes stop_codon:yes gene_type:complete
MNWITKVLKFGEKIKTAIKKRPSKEEIENSKWTNCCKGPILKKELEENLWVCSSCNKHHRINCRQRFNIIFGTNNYEILDTPIVQDDPLNWEDSKPYKDRLKSARKKTGQECAVMIVKAKINNINVTAGAFDFAFIGGSVGASEGEAIIYGIQNAIDNKQPFILFTASGGMRMFESLIALSQMTRVTLAVNELKKNNLPYIVVLTDPTAGGTTASFGMLADITLAEPGAIVAFAGKRVIQATVKEELPPDFQTSEYLREKCGFIDSVIERKDLKEKIGSILSILLKIDTSVSSVSNDETTESNLTAREAS